jgi:hypothetical protein
VTWHIHKQLGGNTGGGNDLYQRYDLATGFVIGNIAEDAMDR